MRTTIWKLREMDKEKETGALRDAAEQLRTGGIVAFPTETVYGLGADARRTDAVERVFAAKGRPADNPLIVHIASLSQLDELVEHVSEPERKLMDRFWPGPLTLILPVCEGVLSARVTCGLSTVGVRMPDHPVARMLIEASGCPIAAPSANRSGRPSPTRAEHVLEDLEGRIDGVLDGGPTGVGLESTVIELVDGVIHVLRPGGVTVEMLEAAGFEVAAPALGAEGKDIDPADAAGLDTPRERQGNGAPNQAPSAPRSPGVKYTHYAPRGELAVVVGDDYGRVAALVQARLDAAAAEGERTGVLAFSEHAGRYRADVVLACGSIGDPAEAARELYAALRSFDEAGVTRIFAEGIREEGIGLALMNRLRKAAGGRVIRA